MEDRRDLSGESLLILLAMQLFPEGHAVDPAMCILMQRREEAGGPEAYRLLIADDKEAWTYAMSLTLNTVKQLAIGGFLQPCELEGDPREHYVFSPEGIETLGELAKNIRKSAAEAGLKPPPGAH